MKSARRPLPPLDPASPEQLAHALCSEAGGGNMPQVERLLAAGADPKRASWRGSTALICAAANGFPEAAKLLIPLSDPLAADDEGGTALHYAAKHGHAHCAKLLLPVSDPSARDAQRRQPIACAAANGHSSCVELLMPHWSPRSLDADGRNALANAIWSKQRACFDILLPLSTLDCKDRGGLSLIQIARRAGSEDMAQAVLAEAARREAAQIAGSAREPASARPPAKSL